MTSTEQVLIFDADPFRAASIVALLEQANPTRGIGSIRSYADLRSEGSGQAPGLQALQMGQVALVIVVEDAAFAYAVDKARGHDVPILLVLGQVGAPSDLAARVRGFDGWMSLDAIDRELPARVADLLGRRARGSTLLPTIDPKFLALTIHDLRTPLNVIFLTIRALAQTIPPNAPQEIHEDLAFLSDNGRQMDRMLAQLGDFCRLIEAEARLTALEFDPNRFLHDFLEDRRGRNGWEPVPILIEVADDAPTEVALDPERVRLALHHALHNAISAAVSNSSNTPNDVPVRIKSSRTDGRWIIKMVVDKPPPSTVLSMELRPDRFERLAGSAAERRGLDLAIAARVSEMFGGSARLEVEPGRRTSIVLDWPAKLPGA